MNNITLQTDYFFDIINIYNFSTTIFLTIVFVMKCILCFYNLYKQTNKNKYKLDTKKITLENHVILVYCTYERDRTFKNTIVKIVKYKQKRRFVKKYNILHYSRLVKAKFARCIPQVNLPWKKLVIDSIKTVLEDLKLFKLHLAKVRGLFPRVLIYLPSC